MSSSIVSGVQKVREAQEHFQDFIRQHPGSKGAKLFRVYDAKLQWILTDLKTTPALSEPVRIGIAKELQADAFIMPAIMEKIALLTPENRASVELLIDNILNGEPFEVQLT
jgi:hypothetical protein